MSKNKIKNKENTYSKYEDLENIHNSIEKFSNI